ncbi:MAG: division/cell wall cluster transcriptional repressor MraZ [Treponema sp.]|nr:division/cell wall cluster transcriptional repressor MraZ [Treponema sp.]
MENKISSGTFESTLDEKGRVVIPAALRDHFMGKLVITHGEELSVRVFTKDGYEKHLNDLKKDAPKLDYDQKLAYKYLYQENPQKAEIDSKTGRIPIPAYFRTYAKLSKDCLVLSIDGHLEIWDTGLFLEFLNNMRLIAKEATRKRDSIDFYSTGEQS